MHFFAFDAKYFVQPNECRQPHSSSTDVKTSYLQPSRNFFQDNFSKYFFNRRRLTCSSTVLLPGDDDVGDVEVCRGSHDGEELAGGVAEEVGPVGAVVARGVLAAVEAVRHSGSRERVSHGLESQVCDRLEASRPID